MIYTIEGEKFSLDDVIARLPNIKRDTIIRRLRSGLRTWAELSKDPKVAALENRRNRGNHCFHRICWMASPRRHACRFLGLETKHRHRRTWDRQGIWRALSPIVG